MNEYQSIVSSLADLQRQVDNLIRKRANSAKPISAEAEQVHQEVLTRINQFTPSPIERKVFSSREISGQGCLVEMDGKTHVLVHKDVADFYPSIDYSNFKLKNYPAVRSPKQYFQNVVAHEYGHILFGERIKRQLNYQLRGSRYNADPLSLPVINELDEAFAFSFGDRVTNLKSSIEELAEGYRKEDFDPTIMLSMYHHLNTLAEREGKAAMFNIQNLENIVRSAK